MSDTVTAGTARAQLADARLYLCTGGRKQQGDLAEFLDAVLAGASTSCSCGTRAWRRPRKSST